MRAKCKARRGEQAKHPQNKGRAGSAWPVREKAGWNWPRAHLRGEADGKGSGACSGSDCGRQGRILVVVEGPPAGRLGRGESLR